MDNNKASLFMQRLEHVDAHYDGVLGQNPVVAMAAERHRRIYLAGPMTGLPEYNYPAFNAEAARLRALGYHVENPAENPEQSSWEDYLRQAIRQMLTCDMVALLPGWEGSRGAGFERSVALQVGMALVMADQVTGIPAAPTVKAEQLNPGCCGTPENCPIDYSRCPHLGQPPAPSLPAAVAAVEEVEVVAYLHERSGAVATADNVRVMEEGSVSSGYTIRLMTVAQHERIVAALLASHQRGEA